MGSSRIVLCAPGHWKDLSEFGKLSEEFEMELEGPDPRMVTSFTAAASPITGLIPGEELNGIAGHTSVAYILSDSFTKDEAPRDAHVMLKAAAELLELGAMGIKCESSGTAFPKQDWISLQEKCDTAFRSFKQEIDEELKDGYLFVFWESLFDAYVRYPIITHDVLCYTCGMHLLGLPDMQINLQDVKEAFPEENPEWQAADYLRTLGLYALTECNPVNFKDGQTFRCTDKHPYFTLSQHPCTFYKDDDFFHNFNGYWRLSLKRD